MVPMTALVTPLCVEASPGDMLRCGRAHWRQRASSAWNCSNAFPVPGSTITLGPVGTVTHPVAKMLTASAATSPTRVIRPSRSLRWRGWYDHHPTLRALAHVGVITPRLGAVVPVALRLGLARCRGNLLNVGLGGGLSDDRGRRVRVGEGDRRNPIPGRSPPRPRAPTPPESAAPPHARRPPPPWAGSTPCWRWRARGAGPDSHEARGRPGLVKSAGDDQDRHREDHTRHGLRHLGPHARSLPTLSRFDGTKTPRIYGAAPLP